MTPHTSKALASMRYCPHNGGHPIQADRHLIIAMPSNTGIGLPLYSGCHDCLLRAIAALDTPPRASIEPHLKELLIRARAAIVAPLHYTEIDALIRAIDAAVALAD